MYTDANLRVSTDQDVGQTTGNYVSTNTVDLGGLLPDDLTAAIKDLGAGGQVYATFAVTADITTATTATIQFQIISSASDDLSSPEVIGVSQAITTTSAAPILAGTLVAVACNPDVDDVQGHALRYLGVRYVIGGATTTGGTVTADFVLNYQDVKRFYPRNPSITFP
jgi:hypothetical protein